MTSFLLTLNRDGRKFSLNASSIGEKNVPTLGGTLWTNFHYCWISIIKPAYTGWGGGGVILQILTGSSPPLPKFHLLIHPSLFVLIIPHKNPGCRALSPWLHSNGSMSDLASSYETLGYLTNCDLSGSINKPQAGPSILVW